MFSRFPGTSRSAFPGVCSDSGLKCAFCPRRIVRWVSVRFLREDVFWLSAAFYSINAKPDILPARPDSIGKWPPGNKEKHEQLLRTDFCSKLCGKLRWSYLERGCWGLPLIDRLWRRLFRSLVAAGFTTIMACCGRSMPSLLHWSRYVRCK